MQTLIDYSELPKDLQDFIKYKQTVQGRSKKTTDEYALDIRTFSRWLMLSRSGADLEKIDEDTMTGLDISGLETGFYGTVTPDEIYGFLYYALSDRENQWAARAR